MEAEEIEAKEWAERLKRDINAVNRDGQTLTHYMAHIGSAAGIRLIVGQFRANANKVDPSGNTPLHYAARRGHEEAVRELLRLGGNPQTKNYTGDSPAVVAERAGYRRIGKLLRSSAEPRPN